MEISHIFQKKRLIRRYSSYPNYLFSLFSQHQHQQQQQQLPLSFFSKPISFSLNPPNTVSHSHQLHASKSPFSLISSSFSTPLTSPFFQSVDSLVICPPHNIRFPICFFFNSLLRPHCNYRLFSVSSTSTSTSLEAILLLPDNKTGKFENNVTPEQISEIIEVIRKAEDDMESKLNLMMGGLISLSVKSISAIFQVLNSQRASGLRFFEWVCETNLNLCYNPKLCSLIIDNCGWLGDYEAMTCLLKDFAAKRICLTDEAFGFIPVLCSSKDSLMESTGRIIAVLNEVGGSCSGSGIVALINFLCKLDFFEIAKFAIEISDRKVSYYNILVRDRCRRCHFEEACDLLNEMRQFGCDPDAKTYNFLLSNLCRNYRTSEACGVLEEMQEKGCSPNELTFEILIYFSCRQRKLDFANQFLDRMLSRGLQPRLSTHAAFIKGYFDSGQYEDAYKYMVGAGTKYGRSSHMIYSLLASLHQKKGDLIVARNILVEMMEKGLKPNFPVYVRISKRLHKSGKGYLARDLKIRFSRFKVGSSTVT